MNYRNTISIKQPRFSRKDVLVAPYRIQPGINRIVFTDTWQSKQFFMDGSKMREYPLEPNGTIDCHAIPWADFEQINKDTPLAKQEKLL